MSEEDLYWYKVGPDHTHSYCVLDPTCPRSRAALAGRARMGFKTPWSKGHLDWKIGFDEYLEGLQ